MKKNQEEDDDLVNFEYYKVFCEVVKAGSVSKAAKKLCVTQPAVSQVIKNMENELGGILFERNSSGLRLTKEGEVLYSYVKKGYDAICLGEEKYKNMLEVEFGELVIGASDMTLQYFLLPYLEEFHDEYPNIKISVTNAPTPETLNNLKEGLIDFGIVSTPFKTIKDIKSIEVRDIETIFIAGSDYAKYKNKIMTVDEIAKLPLICLESDTSTRKAIDEYFFKEGVRLEPEFELATSDIIVQFARRNLGIGIVVSDFAKDYIENGYVFEIAAKKKIETRKMSVVISKKNHLSSASKKLLEIIGIN